jgi:menaquinone-dependent protoporphyrinogen oxidase
VMSRLLIVYATREGQTGKIARHMAHVLAEAGHEARLFDADHPGLEAPIEELSSYDSVVVAAPIHAGGYPRSIVRFAREHATELAGVPSAFVSVGLAVASKTTDGRAETQPLIERFVTRTGWKPGRVELVAGALPYSKYNFIIRYVMKRIAGAAGGDTNTSRDYEYTDWAELDRFTRELSGEAAGAQA